MTQNCVDIGLIQAFLDGELDSAKSETVARHVSVCDDCAILLAEAEEESAFAFTALEQEFNTLVPTQRLWTKINDSIEKEKKSFWKPIFAFVLKPQTAAFASLIFVAVVSITLLSLKPNEPIKTVASSEPKVSAVVPANTPTFEPSSTNAPEVKSAPQILPAKRIAPPADNQIGNEFRAVRTSSAVRTERKPENVPSNVAPEAVNPAPIENIRGEESYLKTIATLTETVNERKDQTLTASSRFAFERDLAVTNDAIKQMKREVQKNPKNEAAKQILRASYQNKIDLLNSVANKTELMASLK